MCEISTRDATKYLSFSTTVARHCLYHFHVSFGEGNAKIIMKTVAIDGNFYVNSEWRHGSRFLCFVVNCYLSHLPISLRVTTFAMGQSCNRPILQIPQCIRRHLTMHHFVSEMCTHVHIFDTTWCIVGYGTDALWDLWDWSIAAVQQPSVEWVN